MISQNRGSFVSDYAKRKTLYPKSSKKLSSIPRTYACVSILFRSHVLLLHARATVLQYSVRTFPGPTFLSRVLSRILVNGKSVCKDVLRSGGDFVFVRQEIGRRLRQPSPQALSFLYYRVVAQSADILDMSE